MSEHREYTQAEISRLISERMKIANIEEVSEDEYWQRVANEKKVEPLKHPCDDCAITTGFYLPQAERLLQQPIGVRNKVVDVWSCHNNCNRGCAGIREYLESNSPRS